LLRALRAGQVAMSRWFLFACCLFALAALSYGEPARAPDALSLGGACARDRECQVGLTCTFEPGVIDGQCTAACNSSASCQERFGAQSVCLGADLCARTCTYNADCGGGFCNIYSWCESDAP
jgi:hypothetical protein